MQRNPSGKGTILLAYIIAIIVAAVLSSIIQSLFNLAAIAALVEQLPLRDWLYTIWFDLGSFTPTMLVIMTPLLLATIFSALGLLVALWAINTLAPMPTLIAASRSLSGSFALALCAAAGAALYVRLTSSGKLKNNHKA
jgi:hypothetical protein